MTTDPLASNDLVLMSRFYPPHLCDAYLRTLVEEVNWSDDYYMAFGRRISIPRLQAWYAEEGIRYSYSNNLLQTQAWIDPLTQIKRQVEHAVQRPFNSVLLTYYRDGTDSVSWHADDEAELGGEPYIASLSLGASRDLHYRHRREQIHGSLTLHHGDLLLMRPGFQYNWEHCVPEQSDIAGPRINLTFRLVTAEFVPGRPFPPAQQAS
jgi:alkylated DNA repair dioxygenase AlkB